MFVFSLFFFFKHFPTLHFVERTPGCADVLTSYVWTTNSCWTSNKLANGNARQKQVQRTCPGKGDADETRAVRTRFVLSVFAFYMCGRCILVTVSGGSNHFSHRNMPIARSVTPVLFANADVPGIVMWSDSRRTDSGGIQERDRPLSGISFHDRGEWTLSETKTRLRAKKQQACDRTRAWTSLLGNNFSQLANVSLV